MGGYGRLGRCLLSSRDVKALEEVADDVDVGHDRKERRKRAESRERERVDRDAVGEAVTQEAFTVELGIEFLEHSFLVEETSPRVRHREPWVHSVATLDTGDDEVVEVDEGAHEDRVGDEERQALRRAHGDRGGRLGDCTDGDVFE